jgi:hypothetical protein
MINPRTEREKTAEITREKRKLFCKQGFLSGRVSRSHFCSAWGCESGKSYGNPSVKRTSICASHAQSAKSLQAAQRPAEQRHTLQFNDFTLTLPVDAPKIETREEILARERREKEELERAAIQAAKSARDIWRGTDISHARIETFLQASLR